MKNTNNYFLPIWRPLTRLWRFFLITVQRYNEKAKQAISHVSLFLLFVISCEKLIFSLMFQQFETSD
jgi:hypothetical protein